MAAGNSSDNELSDIGFTSSSSSPSFQRSSSSVEILSEATSHERKGITLNGEIYTYTKHLRTRKKRFSWIFEYGIELLSHNNTAKWWCQLCRKSGAIHLLNASGTTHIKTHLMKAHQIKPPDEDLKQSLAVAQLALHLHQKKSQYISK